MSNLLSATLKLTAIASVIVAINVSAANHEVSAEDYLTEVIGIMQHNAMAKDKIDWVQFEQEVRHEAREAITSKDTYRAIWRAFRLLGDNHSHLRSSDGQILVYDTALDCTEQLFDNDLEKLAKNKIGYVKVDAIDNTNSVAAQAYAAQLQQTIKQQDSADLRGWVVDVRENWGGNMWPMLAGLGPILGEGIHGYFVDSKAAIPWRYTIRSAANGREYGSISSGVHNVMQLSNPYRLKQSAPRIVVLSSNQVGSSGEAVLVAFKKLPNTTIIGTDSCGLSTANQAFPLSDGTVLYITSVVMADQEQVRYGGRVPVDKAVPQKQIFEQAIALLKTPITG